MGATALATPHVLPSRTVSVAQGRRRAGVQGAQPVVYASQAQRDEVREHDRRDDLDAAAARALDRWMRRRQQWRGLLEEAGVLRAAMSQDMFCAAPQRALPSENIAMKPRRVFRRPNTYRTR